MTRPPSNDPYSSKNSPAHAANIPSEPTDTPSDPPSATDQAKDMAQSGKQAATEVAQTATDAAKDVAAETKDRASDLYAATKSQLGEQVVSQKGSVVEGLRSLGDQLAAMTDDVHQSGTALDFAIKARDQARSAADWLDDREPSQIVDELRTIGRKQPGRFLLGALVAGVVAGRLTRGVVAVHTDDAADNNTGTQRRDSETSVADTGRFGAVGTPASSPTISPQSPPSPGGQQQSSGMPGSYTPGGYNPGGSTPGTGYGR